MANRDCNLECVKDKDDEEIVEFVGPVKIILVDQPKKSYRFKVHYAAFIVLAQMAMATTAFIVMFYSLSYKKRSYMKGLHVFLCTAGLLLPTGVLTMNSLNGAAAPMTVADRKFEHGLVQIFGLGITIAGAVVSRYAGYEKIYTIHSILGMVASGLGVLGALVGLYIYIFPKTIIKDRSGKNIVVLFHQIFGALTIAISSACLIKAIIEKSFTGWLPLEEILYCLCFLCVFYTCVVIYKPYTYIKAY